MKINRYNRSFIGLMEMCYDGKWCKWEDVEKEMSIELTQLNKWYNYYRNAYETLFLEKYNPKVAILKGFLKGILVISIICNLVLAAKIDGVL